MTKEGVISHHVLSGGYTGGGGGEDVFLPVNVH